jgi:hypothetical protein
MRKIQEVLRLLLGVRFELAAGKSGVRCWEGERRVAASAAGSGSG